MASPRISLCMIVRDESKMIDACLSSVKGFVSEIIVVDTGSQDDTVARARKAGAKVWSVAWRDDFAWARNESLRHATGDWVLVLDADERLAPSDFQAIGRSLARASFDCAMLRLHDAETTTATFGEVISGAMRQGDPQRVPRLIRRRPDLRYVGVIHEDLAPWIVKHGRKVVALEMDIVHYGASREIYAERGKFERNVRLLTKLAADSPEDPTALGYLAHQYLGNDKLALARQAADEGWRRLRHVEATPGTSVLRLAEARAQLQFKDGDTRGALDTALRARKIEGPHYDLDYITGFALELLGAAERDPATRSRLLFAARACFETCLASVNIVFLQAFVSGATSWASSIRLGAVALLLGDTAVATEAFQAALAERPSAVEARLGLLDAAVSGGTPERALEMVRAYLEDETLRATPDLWVLAARACELLGGIDDMARFLQHARAAKPPYVHSRRRQLHAELIAGLSMYRGNPVAAPGLVGCIAGVMARAAIAPSEVGAWSSRLEIVQMLLANLARAGHLGLVEPLFEPRANIIVPGLTDHVRRAAADLGHSLIYEPPAESIAVRGEDAAFIAGMLSAHPRLKGRVHLGDGSCRLAGRVIDTGYGGATSSESSSSVVQMTRRRLVDDPVTQCDLLLGALGEGDSAPLVRYLVESHRSASNISELDETVRVGEVAKEWARRVAAL